MNTIIFIGSSGMLGKPVTKELMNAGYSVTLLARDEEKMKKLFPSATTVTADVFDKAGLAKAFAGQEIVYLNLSVDQSSKKNDLQTEREGIQNIIDTAKAAGIKRIAYLSSLIKNYQGMNGFNWWSFEIKQHAVEMIKNSGIAYSIFYPSTFMECLDKQMMKGNKLMLMSGSVAPMWFIAAEDYGKQVAKALQIAGNTNQEYAIQGADPYTFDEAAAVFIKNHNRPLKTMKAPISILKFLGNFNQRMNYAANICEALNKYPEKFESEKTWADLEKPAISLAQYAKAL